MSNYGGAAECFACGQSTGGVCWWHLRQVTQHYPAPSVAHATAHERIEELERDLAAAEEALSNERDDAEDRVSRVERDLAAARRLTECYAKRLTQAVELADKAVARAEWAQAAGANLGRRLVKAQDELGCAEADSARLLKALEKYGEHRAGCALGELPAGENGCDCDFDAVLDAARAAEQGEAK